MNRVIVIRFFCLVGVFCAVSACASLKFQRYSDDVIWLLENANEVETFLLNGYDYDRKPNADTLVEGNGYLFIGKDAHALEIGPSLDKEQIKYVTALLLDESSYTPPSNDILDCLFEPTYALRFSSERGTVIAIMSGSCSQIRLIDEDGNNLGGGDLIPSSEKWELLFEELFKDA